MTAEPLDLDELERLLAEAAPQPWQTYERADGNGWFLAVGPITGWKKLGFIDNDEEAALLDRCMRALPQLISSAREVEGLRGALQPELLDAIADEIQSFEHSARADSLRLLAQLQRAALSPSDAGGGK